MADNVVANAGSGGSTFAADDVGGVLYARAKVVTGADGSATDVSAAAPMPVKLTTAASAEIGVAAVPMQVSLANHAANSTAVKVDNSAVTQPVSNAGTFAVQVSSIAAGTNGIGKLTANSGVDIGDVDVTSLVPGVTATSLGKAEDAAHSSGDTGVMTLAVRRDTAAASSGTTGDYEPLSTNATGQLWVEVGASALPSGAATSAKQDTLLAAVDGVEGLLTSMDIDTSALMDTAHDAADAGNPVKVGAKATTSISAKTMVVNNDRSDLFCGTDGVLIVRMDCNLEDVVQDTATNTNGTSTAFASGLAAPGANIRIWLRSIIIANSSATFVTVDIRDGAAGSVLAVLPAPPTSGVVHRFDPPLRFTANTAVAYDTSAGVSTISISASGFKSKV